MGREGECVRHTDTQSNEATLLTAGQAQTPALPGSEANESSPVILLHAHQTDLGYGEPLSGEELNSASCMCSTCRGADPLTSGVRLPVSARFLDDILQMVLTEQVMPHANTEGTFQVILDDINFGWSCPTILFLVSQVSKVLFNEPTIDFFKQNY
jgi:hypothetical protein